MNTNHINMPGLGAAAAAGDVPPGQPGSGASWSSTAGVDTPGNHSSLASRSTLEASARGRAPPAHDPELRGMVRLLVWGVGHMSPDAIWRLLRRAVNSAELMESMVKVQRVRQRDGVMRSDVFVQTEVADEVERALTRASRRAHWYVKRHVAAPPDAARQARRHERRAARREQGPCEALRVATLNVCGVRGKRPEVAALCDLHKLDVLGLQELKRRPEHWRLTFGGYTVMEGAESQQIRGVALLVRSCFTSHQVGRHSPHCVFARICGGGLPKPMVVGSVYIPPARDWRDAAEAVRAEIVALRGKYAGDDFVLLGDFNCKPQRLVTRVLRTATTGLSAVAMTEGVSETFHRADGRPVSRIDYVCVAGPAYDAVESALVDQRWDASDHWPVVVTLRILQPQAPGEAGPAGGGRHGSIPPRSSRTRLGSAGRRL